MKTTAREYIGDGVYISHDGYHVWLHLTSTGGQGIALAPYVLESFEAQVKEWREKESSMHPDTYDQEVIAEEEEASR